MPSVGTWLDQASICPMASLSLSCANVAEAVTLASRTANPSTTGCPNRYFAKVNPFRPMHWAIEASLWRFAENANEALAYLGLSLDQSRIKRREIRHVCRPRQQSQESRTGRLRIELSWKTKTQDLGEVLIKLHGRPKYFRILDCQNP